MIAHKCRFWLQLISPRPYSCINIYYYLRRKNVSYLALQNFQIYLTIVDLCRIVLSCCPGPSRFELLRAAVRYACYSFCRKAHRPRHSWRWRPQPKIHFQKIQLIKNWIRLFFEKWKNYLSHIRVIILVPFLVTVVQAIRGVVTSTRCPMMTNNTYQIIPAFLFVEKNI